MNDSEDTDKKKLLDLRSQMMMFAALLTQLHRFSVVLVVFLYF